LRTSGEKAKIPSGMICYPGNNPSRRINANIGRVVSYVETRKSKIGGTEKGGDGNVISIDALEMVLGADQSLG